MVDIVCVNYQTFQRKQKHCAETTGDFNGRLKRKTNIPTRIQAYNFAIFLIIPQKNK